MENSIVKNVELEQLQNDLESLEIKTLVEDVKKSKKKANIKIAINIGEAIVTTAMTGLCIHSAAKIVENEEINKVYKGAAIGLTALSVGLAGKNIYTAINKAKTLHDTNKKYGPVLNLFDNIDQIKNPNTEKDFGTKAFKNMEHYTKEFAQSKLQYILQHLKEITPQDSFEKFQNLI
jgi:hypothetical protein